MPDSTSATVLDSIIAGVVEDLQARKRQLSLTQVQEQAQSAAPPLDAIAALRAASSGTQLGLIAEVKRASPSKGALAEIADPAALASSYAQAGATAISVLTEQRRFNGSLADLDAVRAAVQIPVLRKDFMVDPYQFFEGRAHGADLVLLIVAALSDAQLREFYALSQELGMTALVETHTEAEVERAVELGAELIGVNARDLTTLEVFPDAFSRLVSGIPAGALAVAESGILTPADAQLVADSGAHAILVGEALVTAGPSPQDTAAAVTALRSVARPQGGRA